MAKKKKATKKKRQVKRAAAKRPVKRAVKRPVKRAVKKNAARRPKKKAAASVKVLGQTVKVGSAKHARLLQEKRHYEDLQRGENGRGNPSRRRPVKRAKKAAQKNPAKSKRITTSTGWIPGTAFRVVMKRGQAPQVLVKRR